MPVRFAAWPRTTSFRTLRGTGRAGRWTASRLACLASLSSLACNAPAEEPTRSEAGRDAMPPTAARDVEHWQLGSLLVQIGSKDGNAATSLYDVRNVLRLNDGTIVAANRGNQDLRFFGPAGRWLITAGRAGDGPGEFRDLRWAQRWRGDTVVAYDSRHQRLSFFDRDGRLGRETTVRLPSGVAGLFVIGLFDDGSMAARAPTTWANAEQPLGLVRLRDRLFRIEHSGAPGDSIGWSWWREVFNHVPGPGRFAQRSAYFARNTWYAVWGNNLFVADNASYQIQQYDQFGTLTGTIGKPHDNLPVTDDDIAVIHAVEAERMAAWSPAARERGRRLYRSIPMPTTMPAFGHLGRDGFHVDARGRPWVREYNRPGDETPRWSVFGTDHRLIATISLPPRFEIGTIGVEEILGVWRDSLDVEYVRMYEILRRQLRGSTELPR